MPSGTQVFDWTLPREWNIRGALARRARRRARRRLRRLEPARPRLQRPGQRHLLARELRPHLFTDPERPDVIPYRTSYHNENWGFCLPHAVYERLPDGEYEVVIDSTLEDGQPHLRASASCPARATTRCCSRPTSATPRSPTTTSRGSCSPPTLARHLDGRAAAPLVPLPLQPGDDRPADLALAQRGAAPPRSSTASSPRCVGDPGPFTYKRSRRGDRGDRPRRRRTCARRRGDGSSDFTPLGGDERQFCSPGFDLPVGVLSRTPHDQFPGVPLLRRRPRLRPARGASPTRSSATSRSSTCSSATATYRNLSPKGEPQLGKRGLYRVGRRRARSPRARCSGC